MITLSIDVTKIDKNLIKTVTKKDGSEAKYLNLVLMPNRDGKDIYGNDGFVKQNTTKAQRDEGIQTQILGNYQDKGDGGFANRASAPSPSPLLSHNVAKGNGYAPQGEDNDPLPF